MNKSYYCNMFSPAMNIFSRGELSFSRLIVLILEKRDICKHPIKYTIKNGCISFQVKQPSMVVSPSFFIPFFPFVWQHL